MFSKANGFFIVIVFSLLLVACGGGGDQAAETTGGTDTATTPAPTRAPSMDDEPYTLSGTVVDPDGAGIPGIQILFSPFMESVTTDELGNWSKSDVTRSSLTVVPHHQDYEFDDAGYPFERGDGPMRIVATPIGCPETTPCKIAKAEDLQNIRDDVEGYYVLVNDIDATETKDWNDGQGFEPIGAQRESFVGRLDGNGFDIVGLHIHRPNESHVALFRFVGSEGEIRNIGLVDGEITGGRFTGSLVGIHAGLVADAHNGNSVTGFGEFIGGLIGQIEAEGVVKNSYNTGAVRGDESTVGGIAGDNRGGMIEHSYNAGPVTVADGYVGGIVSTNDYGGTIQHSYNIGPIEGGNRVGGIVANNGTDGSIRHVYNTGSIRGSLSIVGGVAGSNDGGLIEYASNRGDVAGMSEVGGIVGSIGIGGIVTHAYNTGTVKAEQANAGGIAGQNSDSAFGNMFNAIRFVYNHGAIQGQTGVGGLVGIHSSGATIEHGYSTGPIQVVEGHWDTPSAGGAIGEWRIDRNAPDEDSVIALFYDENYFAGGPGAVHRTDEGKAVSGKQLQDTGTFTDAGWDFDDVWIMGADGYPELTDNPRP